VEWWGIKSRLGERQVAIESLLSLQRAFYAQSYPNVTSDPDLEGPVPGAEVREAREPVDDHGLHHTPSDQELW